MYPGSYYSHTIPYYYSPNDNDPNPKHNMKMDPNPVNSPYQPWPYAPNYYYPAPLDYHGCCNRGYFGGGHYGFRPPFPNYQLPPPPPLHSPGFYPPFPGAYSIPPPYYSVEQPKYDYDKKNQSPHHCCGCKHQEDEKKASIKREEREVDKKTSDSLVPLLLKDCPYPVMWVPPGYMNTESKATEKDKYSHEPVLSKTLEPAKREGNHEVARDQQRGDSGNGDRFPFPLFWLPSNSNEGGNDIKEKNVNSVAHDRLPDEMKKQTIKNDEAESETTGKHVVQKVIPVKQVGTDEEKKIPSEMTGKHVVQKLIPVKQVGTDEKKKIPKRIETKAKFDSVENTEGKSSPKSSKLPPVCLRVDPLPRKKKTSRSPSPPGDKERSKGSSVNDLKSSQQNTQMSEELKKKMENQIKGDIKTIEVTNAANKVEEDSLADHGDDVSSKEADGSQKEVVQGQSCEGKFCEVREKKYLLEHEAALIVQSMYRGFEVRKSQPLKKLRQISEVKKQVAELRNRIQDLESSSTICVDDKQKCIIGESIMSLLLKLDTVQGLHPIVRDVRKSVAKDLVGLQEKLDSLTFVKSEAPIDETMPSTEQVENTKDDATKEMSDQGLAQLDTNFKVVESDSVLCENHEVEFINPQDHDGAESCSTKSEPQVELNSEEIEQPVDDVRQEKFDQALTQYDSINGVESEETVDNGGIEAHDVKLVEQNTEMLTYDQLQMLREPEQPVEDVIQVKSDKAQVRSDNNVETVVESGSDIYEKHEVETADFKDDVDTKPRDMTHEPMLELRSHEPSVGELTNGQLENLETEQPVEQENLDPKFDNDVENLYSCEHPEVEAIESQDANVQRHDIDACMVEIKAELPKEDAVHGIQEDFVVSTEEAPKADDIDSSTEVLLEDLGVSPPVSLPESHVTNGGDAELTEDLGEVPSPSLSLTSDVDKRLMEENEKLRVAMEELMKAGNEQTSVIKELTGRVKDLEKKLSRNKKKIKVNNKSRSRGRCLVQEEPRDSVV